MNIWRAQGHDNDHGTIQAWGTSESKVRATFRNEYFGAKPTSVDRIEIPTTATGLVDWLNANFKVFNAL